MNKWDFVRSNIWNHINSLTNENIDEELEKEYNALEKKLYSPARGKGMIEYVKSMYTTKGTDFFIPAFLNKYRKVLQNGKVLTYSDDLNEAIERLEEDITWKKSDTLDTKKRILRNIMYLNKEETTTQVGNYRHYTRVNDTILSQLQKLGMDVKTDKNGKLILSRDETRILFRIANSLHLNENKDLNTRYEQYRNIINVLTNKDYTNMSIEDLTTIVNNMRFDPNFKEKREEDYVDVYNYEGNRGEESNSYDRGIKKSKRLKRK